MKRRKRWVIPAVLLLILIALTAIFRQTLMLYIAPKVVLASALQETVADLEKRISRSPVSVLARGIDPAGRNTIALQLSTNTNLTGAIRYDMDVMVQAKPRRILANGKVSLQNKEIDLSIYLDEEFAAVCSEGILGGNYYGLTYDSFSEDIRANKLVSMLISKRILQDWESKIKTIQDVMAQGMPEVPNLSDVNLKSLAMGILALDADVERVRIDTMGRKETYHIISFEATGTEIASGLAYFNLNLDNLPDEDEEAEFSFWLKDREVIKAEIISDTKKFAIYWGNTALSTISDGDIYIESFDGNRYQSCRISGQQLDHLYQETISYTGNTKTQLSYAWEASSGDLTLRVAQKGESTELALKLIPLDNGFLLETDDFGSLMHLLIGTFDSGDHPCTMMITKGAEFQTPAYKNFVDWSTDDLLTLLSGFGSLLGLK